jgi:hypothetical protein
MSRIGILGIVGLILIVLVLVLWIVMVIRARRNPAMTKAPEEHLPRGPVSGGVMRGDPGQVIPTGEAPRYEEKPAPDEPREHGRGGNGPLDL